MKVEKGVQEEEEEEEEEKDEGRCILVGLQLDSNGRDLLHWALGKVAQRGDRVVAVHVCRSSDVCNKSLIKVLDDYLAVYEGFCTLNQVVLVGRISQGNSIRKVIVKEADLCTAKAVVVGVNKNYSLGGSASLAKYCAKKLPPATALFAVESGKVVFERRATKLPPGTCDPKPNLRSILHPSIGMEPQVIIPSPKSQPHPPVTILSDVEARDATEKKEFLFDQIAESRSSSITALVRSLQEPMPGWPLLRRAASANVEVGRDTDARKMSVVQWVLSLPSRSSPSNQPQLDEENISASTDLYKELEVVFRNNSSNCKWFQIEELQSITSQFSSEKLIGKGGNCWVYKGCLSDGQEAAIKLSKFPEEALKNFLLEADIITSLQHHRIAPLIGVCLEDKNLVTVHKYFQKGSLEEILHGTRAKLPLPWDIRFKVAIGIAEAISYLHNGCPRPIIHRDIKSSNILLSDEFEPQLSDFGLAMWAPTTSSYQTHSDVVGTFGYLAPEYFMYGKVSDKIDVYAFGVILLELLTGRKPISDENPKGQESLVMWATPIVERGDVIDLLDPNLDAKYDEDQMRRTVLAASLCIRRAGRLRPQMKQVREATRYIREIRQTLERSSQEKVFQLCMQDILSLLRGEEELEAWMKTHINGAPNESDWQDDETYPTLSFGSHLGLALLDVDDEASIASSEQNHLSSREEYLKGRWSSSSSFN